MDSAITILQVIRFTFVASILLLASVATRIFPDSVGPPNLLVFEILTLVAVINVIWIFVMRRFTVARAVPTLRADPNDMGALKRWKAGYIVIYGMSEAIAGFGVVLRGLGFGMSLVAPFFLAGIILILFFTPRRPSNAIG
jgi:hypothetical protein